MIETIFFDLDGTLYDFRPAEKAAEFAVAVCIAERAGLPSGEVCRQVNSSRSQAVGLRPGLPESGTWEEWCRQLLVGLHIEGMDTAVLAELYRQVYLQELHPYGDVAPALEALSDGYSLHIITDELLSVARLKLEKLGLAGYFGQVITPTDTGREKPNPRIMDIALVRAGAVKETSLMVGDSAAKDVALARAAGVKAVLVCREEVWPQRANAVPIIHNLLELQAVAAGMV